MVRTFGPAVPLDTPQASTPAPEAAPKLPSEPQSNTTIILPRTRPNRFGLVILLAASVMALFWIGVGAAFLWGYLGPQGLAILDPARKALAAAAVFLPAFLFMAVAAILARSVAMNEATRVLLQTSERLFAADDIAAANAARLARVVRRELDGLNTGLDVAFQRMRSLEAILDKQISILDDAGARAQVRSETIAARLDQENARIAAAGDSLVDAAGRAGETVAGRAAQLKATMESAEGTLKMAAQSLDVQVAGFRAATTAAAEAPLEAARTLEAQAARIADVSDTAIGRAEFVLARHEKHRSQMVELAQRLQEEGQNFEAVLSQQRGQLEQAIAGVSSETQKFATVAGDSERHLDMLMANAVHHTGQLTNAFVREADRLKEAGDNANGVLAALAAALKDAGVGAQTLIAESAGQAKQDARLLVGEAMAECERLLRASGEMNAEAGRIRNLLTETTRELETHLANLPGKAEEEARKIRQTMAAETQALLDMSARTMSTLHARTAGKVAAPEAGAPMRPVAEAEPEGLKGLARKLTARRSDKRPAESKGWEMKTLLAAAEQDGDDIRVTAPGASASGTIGVNTAATVGALQLALADMAINLSALDSSQPGDEEWKRYLSGDRAVFARRLAEAIDESAVNRITDLYRDDRQFHDAADAYLAEFENMLARAREGDGGGLLTSTLLSADTGKVYLAVAYALGRL
jgi:hypothetical protein